MTVHDPKHSHPQAEVTLDPAALRVLAHPLRLTLLDRLRQFGPATARQLAELYGLDSGAASYHLRRLAAGGLIEEDTARGTRRDRWWRALHELSVHEPQAVPSAQQPESRGYVRAVVLHRGEQLHEYAKIVPTLPPAWFEATVFTDHTLRLSAGELTELKRELLDVVERYRNRPETRDAETVSIQVQGFPLSVSPAVPGD